MSKLFRQASRLNKVKYKFELRVDIRELALHPVHKDKDLTIALGKAGTTAIPPKAHQTTQPPRKPAGPWGDTVSLVVSLYRDRHGRYQPKPVQLVVRAAASSSSSSSSKPLAVFRLDASHFASAAGTTETCRLQSADKKDDGLLVAEVACIFLRQSDGTAGSEASSVVSAGVIEEGDEEEEEAEGRGDEGRRSDQDLSGFEVHAMPPSSPESPSSPAAAAAAAATAANQPSSVRGIPLQQQRPPSFPAPRRGQPHELMPPPLPRPHVAVPDSSVQELTRELEALRKEKAEREAELLARVAALEAEGERARAQLAAAEAAGAEEEKRREEAAVAAEAEAARAKERAEKEVGALKARVAAVEEEWKGRVAEAHVALERAEEGMQRLAVVEEQLKEAQDRLLKEEETAAARVRSEVSAMEREMNAALAEARAGLAATEGEREGLQRRVEESEGEMIRLQEQLVRAEQRGVELERAVAAAKTSAALETAAAEEVGRLREQVMAAEQRGMELERAVAAAEEARAQAMAEAAALRERVAEAAAESAHREGQREEEPAVAGRLAESEKARVRAEWEKGQLAAALTEARARGEVLEEERAGMARRADEAQREVEMLRVRVGEYEEERTRLMSLQEQRAEGAVDGGGGGRGREEEEGVSLREQVQEAEEQVAQLREKVAGLERETEGRQEELSRLREDNEAAAAAAREMERSAQLLEARVLQEETRARVEADAREAAEAGQTTLLERLAELEEGLVGERAALKERVRALEAEVAARARREEEEAAAAPQAGKELGGDQDESRVAELIEAKLLVAQLREEVDTLRLQLRRCRATSPTRQERQEEQQQHGAAGVSPVGSRKSSYSSSSPTATRSPGQG